MRVALVSDCYLPRLGGIEVQVAELAEQLRRRGHTVRVVTATADPVDEPASPAPAHVLRMPPPVPLGVPVNPWAGPALHRVLAGADVVHIHLGVLAPFAALAARQAVRLGRPLVLTWHSMVGAGPITRSVAAPWRRWVAAGAVPTAVSVAAAAELADVLGMPSVQVLPDGLDRSSWRPDSPAAVRARAGGAGPPRLVTAMRFAARKRPGQLLGLVHRVRGGLPQHRRPRLQIVGDGPWWPAVAKLVRHTGCSSWVDLPGRVSRPQLREHYRSADLYVSPGRKEAFGLAALEAAASGLPVVGYAGTGVADVVRQGTGSLVGDDAHLVALLQDLLAHPAELERVRTVAHDRARSPQGWASDWDQVGRATESAYARAGAAT
ncbi:MAG: glycosyltransferase family 4 protein [Ornithinimicrobium sp.]|uniref:glycosyltransferase family 4 protein n=1 Tax=Ornithinimicrobium sp. TaxID=1977084 RepID=UPI003D9ACE73